MGSAFACYAAFCNDGVPSTVPLASKGLPLWLLILVPVLAFLALLAGLAAYAVYRSRLWTAVLRVSDRTKELAAYEDVEISEGDGGPIEPRPPKPPVVI